MRRYVQSGLIVLLVILILIVGAAFWYIRSGRFDLLLTRILVTAANDYGARVEIDHLETNLSRLGVKATGIRVYTQATNELVLEVPELTANAKINNFWKQDFTLENIQLLNPKVFVKFDANGVSNFSTFHRKKIGPEVPEERERIKTQYVHARIVDGSVFYDDVEHKINGEVQGVSFELIPGSAVPAISNQITFSFDNAHLTFDNRVLDNIKTNLYATFDDKKATVQSLIIQSPISKTTLQGEVTSIRDVTYEFKVTSEFNLTESAKVFAPKSGLIGSAVFMGEVKGKGTTYEATGELKSDKLAAFNTQVTGFDLNGGLNGSGTAIKFDGKLALNRIHFNLIDLGGFRASVSYGGDVVKVNEFTATTLGGHASGKAEISLEKGSNSSLSADLKGISIQQVAQLATRQSSAVTGTLNGKANLTWKDTDFKTVAGQVTSDFTGEAHPTGENAQPAPFSGNADIVARGNAYDIRKLEIDGASSQIKVAGSITSQLFSQLTVDFKSDNMSVAQQVAESFGVIPESVNNYKLQLDGTGSFNGTVKGKITDPTVAGNLVLDSIKARDEQVGRFTATVEGARDHIKATNAALVRPDGSRVDFTVDAPLNRTNAISVTANVQKLDLPFIVRVIDPDTFQDFSPLGGTLNGNLTLAGLPGSNVTLFGRQFPLGGIHGKMDLTTAGLVIAGEPVERAGGSVTLDDRLLSFNNFSVKYRAGQFDVNGNVNTDTTDYSFTGKVSNLSLDYFKEIREKDGNNFPATGVINADVLSKGNLSKNEINFNLSASGKNITIRNEPIVNPILVVDAVSGEKAKVDLTATIRDQTHHITGNIDLLNDDGPILHAEEVLNNTSLAPYLALLGSFPEGTTGTASGKVAVDGNILEPSNLTATLDLQNLDLNLALNADSSFKLQNSGPLQVTASLNQVEFKQFHLSGEGTDLVLKGIASLSPDVVSTFTANGDVNLRMIGALLTRIGGASLTTGGSATISAGVTGNGDATRLTGFIDIKDFSLRSIDLPVAITNGTGRVIFNENVAQIETLTGQAGGGKLSVTGGVYLSGFIPDRWRFELTGDQVRMNYPQDVRTVADGDLIYQGNKKLQILSGNVSVRRAEYTRDLDIADLIINSRSQIVGGGEATGSSLSLDITVRSQNTLFIRNNIVDAVGSASLRIHGSFDDPIISGQVVVTRGTLDFRGNQYRLTRGLIQLPDSKTGEPYFNIQAEADIKGYRVIIPFIGTLTKFSIQPRTDPPVDQADVIALITTGDILPQDTQRSQALVQAGVGTATSLLAESLTRKVEQRTNRLFGINRLQVDPLIIGRGTDPTARVTVGRQITRDLSVTYSANITQSSQSVFLVEYRLSDRFSFVGVRDQDGRIGFEFRVRKRF